MNDKVDTLYAVDLFNCFFCGIKTTLRIPDNRYFYGVRTCFRDVGNIRLVYIAIFFFRCNLVRTVFKLAAGK